MKPSKARQREVLSCDAFSPNVKQQMCWEIGLIKRRCVFIKRFLFQEQMPNGVIPDRTIVLRLLSLITVGLISEFHRTRLN